MTGGPYFIMYSCLGYHFLADLELNYGNINQACLVVWDTYYHKRLLAYEFLTLTNLLTDPSCFLMAITCTVGEVQLRCSHILCQCLHQHLYAKLEIRHYKRSSILNRHRNDSYRALSRNLCCMPSIVFWPELFSYVSID